MDVKESIQPNGKYCLDTNVNDFSIGCTILTCDSETAGEYGRIKLELTKKGKMIPENDIWIAAVT
jgi:tRNA(fMet)-specific endonuclease VapC